MGASHIPNHWKDADERTLRGLGVPEDLVQEHSKIAHSPDSSQVAALDIACRLVAITGKSAGELLSLLKQGRKEVK